jgi:complement component 1 Q subcomponent-binding protein, mitochondrial
VQTKGPEVTLTRQTGTDKVTVKFNVTNTVNTSESNQDADTDANGQKQSTDDDASTQASSQLKSRPTFTIDIHRGGQTLSFLCSYLPDDYPDTVEQGRTETDNASELEDFQIDEFAIHDGDWNDQVYSADCSVIDGELYDKLLNLLEEHGIGEGSSAMNFNKMIVLYEHERIDIDSHTIRT